MNWNQRLSSLACALAMCVAANANDREPLIGDTPLVVNRRDIASWSSFAESSGWRSLHGDELQFAGGELRMVSKGEDPALEIPLPPTPGPVEVRWRMSTRAGGPAEVFWGSEQSSGFAANRSARVNTSADGQWHDYVIQVNTRETINSLRLDPAISPGEIRIANAQLKQVVFHPLQFAKLVAVEGAVRGSVLNTASNRISFSVAGTDYVAEPGQAVEFSCRSSGRSVFEPFDVSIDSRNLPSLRRRVYLYQKDAAADWMQIGSSALKLEIAADGSGARLSYHGRVCAILSPLAECQGQSVPLKVSRTGRSFSLSGGPVRKLTFQVEKGMVRVDLDATERVTGPVLRVLGRLEQGLLAGVEYLGQGEESSTTLDLEGPEHLRYEPDPSLLTMPLATFVTREASVAMLWEDPSLQPIFSTPNQYDGSPDHLAALKGEHLRYRLRVAPGFEKGGRLEDAVLWAVNTRGLPDLPAPTRTDAAQVGLYIEALTNSILSTNGWYHARWSGADAQWYADHASSLWRLTGKVPEMPALVPGGAHVENPAVFFVTGRAGEWAAAIKHRAEAARKAQQPDGSFVYDGKYRRGHFENTASGICARQAATLLDYAYYTGDAESLAAGIKTLEYMKRFRTPRGAQTWEIPLHTPDILASALLVQAYVRGYELTRNREYLEWAKRWAISGLPFVYQWGRHPVQTYGTIAVLGATDWNSVVWIGLPVQWCGTVYAWSLTLLEKHDQTLDWHRIAAGILRAAEQMQYPEGEFAGALPDSFRLADQRRLPSAVNPCVMISLRLLLAGQLDALAVAANEEYRVAAPFPVKLRDGKAFVSAPPGQAYEILVNGSRVIPVRSQGRDVITLKP